MRDSVFKYDYEVVPEDAYKCFNTTLFLCGSDACEGGKWNTDDFDIKQVQAEITEQCKSIWNVTEFSKD